MTENKIECEIKDILNNVFSTMEISSSNTPIRSTMILFYLQFKYDLSDAHEFFLSSIDSGNRSTLSIHKNQLSSLLKSKQNIVQ